MPLKARYSIFKNSIFGQLRGLLLIEMTFKSQSNMKDVLDDPTDSGPNFFPRWNNLFGRQNKSIARVRAWVENSEPLIRISATIIF